MAVVQNPIVGRARGSVATTTFTTWKGLNVIKSKPISVANPKTPGQVRQRARIRFVSRLGGRVAQVVRRNFAVLAVGKTAFNAFAQFNFQAFDTVDAPGLAFPSTQQLRISQLRFSPNNLDINLPITVQDDDNSTFTLPAGRVASEYIITRINVAFDSLRGLVFDKNTVNVVPEFSATAGVYLVDTGQQFSSYVVVYEKVSRLSRQYFFRSV